MSEVPEEKQEGETRTDMTCTECGKLFIALIDFSLNGNHIIECPHCGHEHCRVVTDGRITEDRWASRYGSDNSRDGIRARRVWKHSVLKMEASSASEFIRQKWLNRYYEEQ